MNELTEQKVCEYECNGETVKLSPSIIKQYLVSGDSANVSMQEVVTFLNLCRYQHLNPFLREAYLIKYGNSPATIVTGKEVFTKRAKRNKDYRGTEAGIYVLDENNAVQERSGTFKLDSETLVGAWARVYIEGFSRPVEMTVSYDEYVGRKRDGSINSQWQSKPATMLRKVALVQALREAFPEDFQGMYSQEEIAVDVPLKTDFVDTSKPSLKLDTPKAEIKLEAEIYEGEQLENSEDGYDPLAD